MYPFLKAFLVHGLRVLAQKLLGYRLEKSTALVLQQYEEKRKRVLEEFLRTRPPFDDFVLGTGDQNRELMLDGKPSDDLRAVRLHYLQQIENEITRLGAHSVIEIGSGFGRNLLWLKRKFPHLEVSGYELSHYSVELSRVAAKHYGIDCHFSQFDATGDWSAVPHADVFLTVHAIEQITWAAPVVDHMVEHARKAVVMIEPFPDFWRGLSGLARKLRALDGYRLRSGSFRNHKPREARLLDFGHILNRPSLVVIDAERSCSPAMEDLCHAVL